MTVIVCKTNRVGSRINEEFNNIERRIFVVTCKVERRTPIIINSIDSVSKVLEKILNYSLGSSFIVARPKKEFIIIGERIIIIGCQFVSLNYFSQTVY